MDQPLQSRMPQPATPSAAGLASRALLSPRRLKYRLLIWIGCALAGAVVVSVVISLVLRDRAEALRELRNDARTLTSVLADHADRVIENADLVMAQAIAMAGSANTPVPTDETTWRSLKALADRSPYLSGIWIGDAYGNAALTSYVFPTPSINVSDHDYFRAARDNPDRMFLGFLARSRYTNTPQITATRRIEPVYGSYRGFVTVDISPEQMRRLYSRLNLGSSAMFWLLDRSGRPLYREPGSQAEQLASLPMDTLAQVQEAPEGAFRAVGPVSGQDTLFVFRRSPAYGLVSLIGMPVDGILATWRQRIWIYAALGGAILVGIIAFAGAGLEWLRREQAHSDELEQRVRERTAELDEALKQKDVLVSELNHRVKNTLATIQSIARQTARHSGDIAAFNERFEARLLALSSTYALLTKTDWGAASLIDLLKAELAPYLDEASRRVVLSGPAVHLEPATALSLGLVVHELATNAAKYGALSVPEGQLRVAWIVAADERVHPKLRIEWHEQGGPAVSRPTKTGFGTRLITISFERIGGTADLQFHAPGLLCRIELPLEGASGPRV